MSKSPAREAVIAWCATCKRPPSSRQPDRWLVGTRYRCRKAEIDNFHVAAIIPESMKPWLGCHAALVRYFRSEYHPRNVCPIRGQAERYGALLFTLMAVALGLASVGPPWAWAGALIGAAIVVDLLAYNAMVAFVTQHPQVPMRNAVYGLAGFALVAVGYAVFYVGMVPESFSRRLDIKEAIYFSFVTIATVGYGDIYPKQDATAAQCLVVGEILTGLFYLAVLLATMVGWANAPTRLATEDELGLTEDRAG